MVMLLSRPRFLLLASLPLVATPGLACQNSAGAQSAAGSPCACLTIAQGSDLNFSIRARGQVAPPKSVAAEAEAQMVAIGTGLKADMAIFARTIAQGKEVSDAARR